MGTELYKTKDISPRRYSKRKDCVDMGISIPNVIYKDLQMIAEREQWTKSEMILRGLRLFLKAYERGEIV